MLFLNIFIRILLNAAIIAVYFVYMLLFAVAISFVSHFLSFLFYRTLTIRVFAAFSMPFWTVRRPMIWANIYLCPFSSQMSLNHNCMARHSIRWQPLAAQLHVLQLQPTQRVSSCLGITQFTFGFSHIFFVHFICHFSFMFFCFFARFPRYSYLTLIDKVIMQ